MEMKVEYIAEEWQLFAAPEPLYTTEQWGPPGRKWDITFISNNPYNEKLRIKGKRYINGEFSSSYVQWL